MMMPDEKSLNNAVDRAARAMEILFARVDALEREVAEIKTVLRQPKGAVTRTFEGSSDIAAQEQRTGMRGHTPYTDKN